MIKMLVTILVLCVLSVAIDSLSTTKNTNQAYSVKPNVKKERVLHEYDLSGNRIVYVIGEIGESNSAEIAKHLLEMGKDSRPITIIINSPGGSVIDGASIISAIEVAKGPVNTICTQLCASMAAIIHSYGTNRLMLNRSLVMYHPATGSVSGEVDKMSSRLGTLKRYIDKMDDNIAKRAGLSLEEFRHMYEVELWLDAEDAVSRRFADHVVFVRGIQANKLYPEFRPSSDKVTITPVNPNNNPFKFNWMY